MLNTLNIWIHCSDNSHEVHSVVQLMVRPDHTTIFCRNDADTPVINNYFGHRNMQQNFLHQWKSVDLHELWLQQVEVTRHIEGERIAYFQRSFRQVWSQANRKINLSAGNGDLTTVDFFLWGNFKTNNYANEPNLTTDLKNKIWHLIH